MGELADYRCHKIVKAGKIIEITYANTLVDGVVHVFVLVEDVNGAPAKVAVPFMALHQRKQAAVGDYVVIYEDGYKSWSPAAVFEAGYDRIEAPQHGLAVK